MVATLTAVATPHALVLTVSHDLLFRQPPCCAASMPPLLAVDLRFALNVIPNGDVPNDDVPSDDVPSDDVPRDDVPDDPVACTI